MSKRFDNKVCIVTGAAQGIGRGVALRLASEGGKIVMADFSPLVEEVLAEIIANGGTDNMFYNKKELNRVVILE